MEVLEEDVEVPHEVEMREMEMRDEMRWRSCAGETAGGLGHRVFLLLLLQVVLHRPEHHDQWQERGLHGLGWLPQPGAAGSIPAVISFCYDFFSLPPCVLSVRARVCVLPRGER